NAGAALGVVLGLTLAAHTGRSASSLAWAFGGALVASLLVLAVAATGRVGASPLRLVLAGSALGARFRRLAPLLLVTNADVYEGSGLCVRGTVAPGHP